MSEANKALERRWFEEVWNNGNANAIGEMVTVDVAINGLSDAKGEAVTGVEAFKEFHSAFRGAFPNIVINVEDIIAENDKVVARCLVQATHTGDSFGLKATQAPWCSRE